MWYVIKDDELYHHGIKGQKWGVRHGPPYPLKSGGNNQQKKTVAGNRTIDVNISKSLYEYDGSNPKQYARTIAKNISDDTKMDLHNRNNAIKKHYKKWDESGDDDRTAYKEAKKASREDEAKYRKQLEQEARRLLGQYADQPARQSDYNGGKTAKGRKAYEDMADYIDFLVVTNLME